MWRSEGPRARSDPAIFSEVQRSTGSEITTSGTNIPQNRCNPTRRIVRECSGVQPTILRAHSGRLRIEFPADSSLSQECTGPLNGNGEFFLTEGLEGRLMQNSELHKGPRKSLNARPEISQRSGGPMFCIIANYHRCPVDGLSPNGENALWTGGPLS